MTRETITASDMQSALRQVKRRYGDDALILETRTRHRRRAGSLALTEQVEVHVGLKSDMTGVQAIYGQELPARSLGEELRRVEDLLVEIENGLGADQLAANPERRYPLTEALMELGAWPESIHRLAADHAEEVPPAMQDDMHEALLRLSAQLNCVEIMALEDLRGHHVLVGPPGVGKSTLALKLARRVALSGARAVLLSFEPAHEGESLRLERYAESYGLETALVPGPEALPGSLRYFSGADLVVLDMPALQAEQWPLLAQLEEFLPGEPMLRHLVLAADGGWRGIKDSLARCDFLALTRGDLASPLTPCLDLADVGEHCVSFLSSGAELEGGLSLARSELLVDALAHLDIPAESPENAESAEVGGGA